MKRSYYIMASVLALSISALLYTYSDRTSSHKGLSELEATQAEMQTLSREMGELNNAVKRLEGRRRLTDAKGVAHAVDAVFSPLGLKDKVKSVKPVQTKNPDEERAEVSVMDVDTNETVSFLHSLENAAMPISVKKIAIKKSFDKPEMLNITMTLSFLVK